MSETHCPKCGEVVNIYGIHFCKMEGHAPDEVHPATVTIGECVKCDCYADVNNNLVLENQRLTEENGRLLDESHRRLEDITQKFDALTEAEKTIDALTDRLAKAKELNERAKGIIERHAPDYSFGWLEDYAAFLKEGKETK